MRDLQRCPHCANQGRTNFGFLSGAMGDSQAIEELMDDQGRKHIHDPNETRLSYRCSDGHKWSLGVRVKCPVDGCDWNERVRVANGQASYS